MLSRFFSSSSSQLHLHLRLLSLTLSSSPSPTLSPPPLPQVPKFGFDHFVPRHFSTHGNNNNGDGNNNNNPNGQKPTPDIWKIASENDNLGGVFGANDSGDLTGLGDAGKSNSAVDDWLLGTGEFKPWNLEDEKKVEDVFGFGDVERQSENVGSNELGLDVEKKMDEVDVEQLQKEEEALTAVLKGPNRAFGDLVAASGITDAMLDSLIALKDFKDIDGLPPLTEIEDKRYENSLKKSSRYEMELQKQEDIAKSRVRQVDEKGRAYGTGRRKCSIARVWIQPGEGKFLINDKDFDVYFPILDHRAALLRPFGETKTLGLWDVKCTVKGGGTSGQVGAIRLGISRALQSWEPGLRPPLREAGFLTRDPRVVERKKPGKAKARKSFQWVKR